MGWLHKVGNQRHPAGRMVWQAADHVKPINKAKNEIRRTRLWGEKDGEIMS